MSAKIVPSVGRPTHDQIAEAAYHIWLNEGRPGERNLEHWTQAETQLIADRMQEAAKTAPPQIVASAIAQALPAARPQQPRTRTHRLAA